MNGECKEENRKMIKQLEDENRELKQHNEHLTNKIKEYEKKLIECEYLKEKENEYKWIIRHLSNLL